MKAYHAVKKVKPLEDFKLLLSFSNGDTRVFDMKPFLNKGIFRELKNVSLFNTVHISFDTIEWDNEADFDPEVLYKDSKKIKEKKHTLDRSTLSSAAEPKTKYGKK